MAGWAVDLRRKREGDRGGNGEQRGCCHGGVGGARVGENMGVWSGRERLKIHMRMKREKQAWLLGLEGRRRERERERERERKAKA
jgi:hypothetical protein